MGSIKKIAVRFYPGSLNLSNTNQAINVQVENLRDYNMHWSVSSAPGGVTVNPESGIWMPGRHDDNRFTVTRTDFSVSGIQQPIVFEVKMVASITVDGSTPAQDKKLPVNFM